MEPKKEKGNPMAPHQVVIWLHAEVREQLPSGELTGNVAHRHPPKEQGQWEAFRLTAQDRNIAIRKLAELIQKMRSEGFFQ